MKSKYAPRTNDEKIGYLVEECGEVLAAAGKSIRWGLRSFNPELPKAKRELNRDWLARELKDLEEAIVYARQVIEEDIGLWKKKP